MSPADTQSPKRTAPTLLVAALIILALILRFWHLGTWNFQATEIFTLRDSMRPQFHNTRPLGYLLNYYLVLPFMPLDEFGLRLLPAVFGVLAVPAFFVVARQVVGTRAALLGTFLITLNPVLISYSQLARYWSLVFLLSAIYPYALYLGIRERNSRLVVIGVVTALLAVLAHPASALLVGGPGVWFLVTWLRPSRLRQAWQQRGVRWGLVIGVILAVVIAFRLLPVLHGWIAEHDQNPGSGQFLQRATGAPGVKQLVYLLAFVDGLTLPVALIAPVGIYMLWRERDRFLAVFLASLALFPIAFLTLISLRTPVSSYYLIPVLPVFFLGAGVFLERLFEIDWRLRPRWLVPAVVTAIVIAAGAPTLASDYRNGRRYDFRGAARWIQAHGKQGDVVFSDQPMVLAHYLAGAKVQRLRYDVATLADSVRALRQPERDGSLWIAAPGLSHALRTNLKQGGLINWIYDHCQLSNAVGTGRVDFRQQYLQIYRCPPASASR